MPDDIRVSTLPPCPSGMEDRLKAFPTVWEPHLRLTSFNYGFTRYCTDLYAGMSDVIMPDPHMVAGAVVPVPESSGGVFITDGYRLASGMVVCVASRHEDYQVGDVLLVPQHHGMTLDMGSGRPRLRILGGIGDISKLNFEGILMQDTIPAKVGDDRILRPVGDNVIIRIKGRIGQTESGILTLETKRTVVHTLGEIVRLGPRAHPELEVGQEVHFCPFFARPIVGASEDPTLQGDEYAILSSGAIAFAIPQ